MNDEPDKIRILAVDDNLGALELIKKRLNKFGHEIVTAQNGADAVELIKSRKPDLLLLDYILEDMTCAGVINFLNEENVKVPFIIMTGQGDERIAVEMMKLGAVDYIVKDINFIDLLPSAVNKIIDYIKTKKNLARSQNDLIAVNEKYRLLFEASADPICFFSSEGFIEEANKSFEDYFGYSFEEITSLNIKNLFKNLSEFEALFDGQISGSALNDQIAECINKNGSATWCLTRIYSCKSINENHAGYQAIFHDMTERIIAEEKIRNINEELEIRVNERTAQLEDALEEIRFENDERIKVQDELISAKEELSEMLDKEKELSDMKTKFISVVSHEYRTPLTVIMTSSYLLQQYFNTGNQRKFEDQLNKIRISVQNMTSMLEGIIKIGKSETITQGLKLDKYKAEEIIIDLMEEINLINTNKHRFIYDINPENVNFITDKSIITQALSNLIINAMKYSHAGSEIFINVQEQPSSIVLSVADRGIGIAEEERDKLFEPFYRSKNAEFVSGTGLGLPIVKKCVESLKGTIAIKSESGQGSEFIITLPKLYQ